jgi:hypothetical protein
MAELAMTMVDRLLGPLPHARWQSKSWARCRPKPIARPCAH